MKTTININLQAMQQVVCLLETLTSAMYRQPLKSLHEHSVGQHTRHIIEFYGCLLAGIKSGSVSYDLRERKAEIETDKNLAVSYLKSIIDRFSAIETDTPLSLQTIVADQPIQTNVQRELIYLIEHTTHHLAIIKIGLNDQYPAFELSQNLGVAASTINYRNQAVAA